MYLCSKCVKDTKLKLYFKSQPLVKEKCTFCKKKNIICLKISDNLNFSNFFTALIRYHYSEDYYNRHWGGNYLYKLFMQDNDILNYHNMEFTKKIDFIIDELCCIIQDKYFPSGDGVYLYYGHIEGIRGCYFESVKHTTNSYLKHIGTKLLEKNYFLYEKEVQKKILAYKKYFKNSLTKSSSFYRARIGYEKKEVSKDLWNHQVKYTPYSNERISAPDTKLVNGGRLNRQGVSFLYLATNIETAINEVRPDPGHKVSIGKFQSTKKLKIVDFDKAFINLSDNEELLDKFKFLNHIDQLFSRRITQDERHKYIITQFFAEIFRKLGFDGIKFTSSLGSGKNLLIFNPKDFKYVDSKKNKVYDILKLKYTTLEL